ncbi:Uncharacterised protein [Mycobacteroides abscessus subsp. abscessus]|nr:Uncharacterised protein [Mycobacteroides abscessus subsp. abscessus]
MVFPLFMMALLWDRFRLGEKKFLRAKPLRFRLGTRILATNTVNLAVAIAYSGEMTSGPAFQVEMGRGLQQVFGAIERWTDPVPEFVLGLTVLALAAVFVIATLRDPRRGRASESGVGCHDDLDHTPDNTPKEPQHADEAR